MKYIATPSTLLGALLLVGIAAVPLMPVGATISVCCASARDSDAWVSFEGPSLRRTIDWALCQP